MLVPDFWAEGRAQHRSGGKQVTVRRFGWSNDSPADAQAMADARAQEALARVLAGEKLQRRDLKVPYNGADGLPIREQVVSRHGAEVITRNSYGALCLNTPRVLFADVDFDAPSSPLPGMGCGAGLVLVAVFSWLVHALAPRVLADSPGWGLSVLAGVLLASFCVWIWERATQWRRKALASQESTRLGRAYHRVDTFVAAHPEWAVRAYRTPAGLRLLATQRVFDPAEPAVAEFFQAMGADPMYVRMCRNQHCFRARLSAKPWRMGMSDRLKPRPGVWPVKPERLDERNAWLQLYDVRAKKFAACRFERSFGTSTVAPEVAPVLALHDEYCRATTRDLPLA